MNIGTTFFGSATNFQQLNSVNGFITLFLNIAFVLAGVILLFFFILGGIGMIGSAGQSDPKKAEEAKKTITSALIGFVIVFVSFWIVKLIGNLIGIPNLI